MMMVFFEDASQESHEDSGFLSFLSCRMKFRRKFTGLKIAMKMMVSKSVLIVHLLCGSSLWQQNN
jgi:hypothetical protein